MIDGLAVIDKDPGWTSHDVVAKCRGIFGQKKVGHSGTLDPDATGILLVGLGRATRLLKLLTALPKTYTGTVVLGVATSTLDASGEVTGEWDMTGVTLDEVKTAAARLTGPIEQIPPMVSAVQVGGRRLHELAREGIEVERQPRPVEVYRFEVAPLPVPGHFAVEVECSSGTYIRTLAADVGTALAGGAHLRDLRRTAIGSFTLDDAVRLPEVSPERVLSPAAALRDYPAVTVAPEVAEAVGHGKVLDREALGAEGPGPWAILDQDGRLLAVYQRWAGEGLKPDVVLAPA